VIQYTTASDVAAEVQMMRSGFPGTVLIVEGDHDCRIYERFTHNGDCRVIPAHGKANAIDAIAITDQAGTRGVVAIVDADFWHILGTPLPTSNIIATDAHDIETMMLESQAINIVLREYAISERMRKFITMNKASHLRDILFLRALPLGLLRLISEEQSLRLKFKGLDYTTVVSRTSLVIDEKLLVTQVLELTNISGISRSQINRLLKQSKKRHYEPRQVCCGHDMTVIMAIALQNAIGKLKVSIATAENIEKWLRMSYNLREFKNTHLYSKTKEWEAANVPYKVFDS
jgi:hypothetical protein